MIHFNSKAALALLCLAAAPLVSAASVNVVPCTGVPLTETELSAFISCPKFTGSNLTQIDILFDGVIEGSITLTNNSNTSQNVSGTTGSEFLLGALGGFTIPVPLFTATFGTGIVSLGAGASQLFDNLSGNANVNITNSNSLTFGDYTGAGTFSIPVSTLTGLTIVGGGGQIQTAQSTQAGINAVVTYTFQDQPSGDVPEPAAMTLTGLGVLAMGLAGRRRSRV